ncbi:MAG: hypothetical protein JO352_18110 [Chloroflexi bacterium]|nr:hypothetical protein [Chloroflexota bacterium]MBV9595907.1 hypothetical protein [Chloroflexota bacterium]
MPIFPSIEWLTEVARLAMHDDVYRRFGRVDASVGLKIGERAFRLTFDVFDIADIREIHEDELRDLDFYLDMEPERWQAMLRSIREHGRAEREFTLNSLDLTISDGLHQNATGDGYRADKFFRYNENLQRFFDLSANVETTFDASLSTGIANSPAQ